MKKGGTLSINLPIWNSKIFQQTTTAGAAQYFYLKPPCKEVQLVLPIGNQDPVLDST